MLATSPSFTHISIKAVEEMNYDGTSKIGFIEVLNDIFFFCLYQQMMYGKTCKSF